jgi:hypothetical protein
MSSEIKVDTISENTSANGIAIDGLTLKDGNVGAAGTATSLAGIPFYNGDTTSIYTHDVSGTDSTAQNNAAYGLTALDAITTGDDNVAIGYGALSALTTGSDNVAIGSFALDTTQSADFNTAVGYQAGTAITSGGGNVFMGYAAGASKTENGDSVFIGYRAGHGCTTGADIVFIGKNAGDGHDTEGNNIGIGTNSLGGSIAGGEENVCMGKDTGSALTSGDHSTLIGYQAGAAVTSGNHTVAVGYQTGYNDAITGNGNTLLGNYAGFRLNSGNENTIVGYDAGTLITTGTNNTCLGRDSGGPNSPSSLSTDDHKIVLGDSNITDLICNDTSISSSDSRDKTDVENFTHGLNYIEQLRPVTYRWDKRAWYVDKLSKDMTDDDVKNAKPDGSRKKNKINVGFLAQEVQAIEEALGYKASEESNLVFNDNDGFQYGLKYERLVPMLVNAIKELSAKVKALEEA